MKKLGLLLLLTLMIGLMNSLFAQKDRALTNGFSVNLVTGFPSASFGAENSDMVDQESELKFGPMFGVQLGNRWYFSSNDAMGFGLMVNWVDFTMAVKGGSINGIDFGRAAIDFTFLEFGPLGTYALGNGMALDAYYNLRPTVFSSALVVNAGSGDETEVYAGFGMSHAIGAAFRINAFNVGLEYNLGGINSVGTYTGSMAGVTLEDKTIKTNSVRIMLGFKF